jgi:hypothetical protein
VHKNIPGLFWVNLAFNAAIDNIYKSPWYDTNGNVHFNYEPLRDIWYYVGNKIAIRSGEAAGASFLAYMGFAGKGLLVAGALYSGYATGASYRCAAVCFSNKCSY